MAESYSASKGKSKGKKGSVDPGIFHGRSVARDIAETECGGQPAAVAAAKEAGRSIEKQREMQGKRPHMLRVRRGLGTPRGCAPVKDGITTWRRTRPKEKTPMKTAVGPKMTTKAIQLGYLGSDSCLTSSPQDCVMHSAKLDGLW